MTMEEMLKKAKAAKSAADIISIAKENGKELSAEKAEAIFKSMTQGGEISDEELESAVGGCDGGRKKDACPICNKVGTYVITTACPIYPEGGKPGDLRCFTDTFKICECPQHGYYAFNNRYIGTAHCPLDEHGNKAWYVVRVNV